MTTKTPKPLRVGDAGMTIFGPPNGQPAPEVIATCRKKGYAAYLAHCVNRHDDLVRCLREALYYIPANGTEERDLREAIAYILNADEKELTQP